MQLIDGKALAKRMREEIAADVAALRAERGVVPGLAVVLVGEDPASVSYVAAKERACAEAGMRSVEVRLPESVAEDKLVAEIARLNADPEVDGVLVQLPLPKGIDTKRVIEAISPEKDVDGFTPVNIGRMMIGDKCFLPCTPHGIVKLIEFAGMDLKGRHVVVIGRSNIVGAADAVVVAAGRPNTLTGDMLRKGAVVIDVGVNRVRDATSARGYRLVGDADFESCSRVASAITPVPGGVGPMTITMLLWNTLASARRRAK